MYVGITSDTFDITLSADVKTVPTLGPLFGSFKLQLDVFECPIRLYHSALHNNRLNIGLDMGKIKLPQLETQINTVIFDENEWSRFGNINAQQINPSSLLAYLGLRGIGQMNDTMAVSFNAVPLIAYYDIYKNYYANKQEAIGYICHSNIQSHTQSVIITGDAAYNGLPYNMNLDLGQSDQIVITAIAEGEEAPTTLRGVLYTVMGVYDQEVAFQVTSVTPMPGGLWEVSATWTSTGAVILNGVDTNLESIPTAARNIQLVPFNLKSIDQMRENILQSSWDDVLVIDKYSDLPYSAPIAPLQTALSRYHIASVTKMEGLALKTFQSDIFNNWLNTEFIDGVAGINDITKIDTSTGSFEINALNLANKVYNMLNRIVVSGGSYDDWISAVYDTNIQKRYETPMYHGGLSKEIVFQEVVQTGTPTGNTTPLGWMAGKGVVSSKHKGGSVIIKCDEPCYILGIVSITPRIDYSQGNEFSFITNPWETFMFLP